MKDLSVIVPVYNGEKTITRLFERLVAELGDNSAWEVIFVHDAGEDNSWEVIKKLALTEPARVKGFSLERNYGQHNAIIYGITQSSGKLVVTIDEDLQHDPALIKPMIEEQQRGDFDVVYARFMKLAHPGTRIRTSEMLRNVLKRTVPGIFPGYSPLRLLKRKTADTICNLRGSYTFIDGAIGMVTSSVGFIDAEHRRRADGRSSYTYYRLFRHAVRIMTGCSGIRSRLLLSALALAIPSTVLLIFTTSSIPVITAIGSLLMITAWLTTVAVHRTGLRKNIMPTSSFHT